MQVPMYFQELKIGRYHWYAKRVQSRYKPLHNLAFACWDFNINKILISLFKIGILIFEIYSKHYI